LLDCLRIALPPAGAASVKIGLPTSTSALGRLSMSSRETSAGDVVVGGYAHGLFLCPAVCSAKGFADGRGFLKPAGREVFLSHGWWGAREAGGLSALLDSSGRRLLLQARGSRESGWGDSPSMSRCDFQSLMSSDHQRYLSSPLKPGSCASLGDPEVFGAVPISTLPLDAAAEGPSLLRPFGTGRALIMDLA
jgi:hypothetical protein